MTQNTAATFSLMSGTGDFLVCWTYLSFHTFNLMDEVFGEHSSGVILRGSVANVLGFFRQF